jgi:heat-inducible transcriptional repressor
MSDALTARQTQILKSIITEYIDTAEPVGSSSLEKKYELGISPATIRNEMVTLTKSGYLRQPYTSAGRTPTPKAMKFYIDQLMDERKMSVAEEVKVKEEVMQKKDNVDAVLDEATRELSELTGSLSVAALDDYNKVWHAGYSHVFENPEFADLEAATSLFTFLEEVRSMQELFFQRMTGLSPVEVIFGEELGWPGFSPVGIVGTRFDIGGQSGALGVIGPTRIRYSQVVPVLRYFKEVMGQI